MQSASPCYNLLLVSQGGTCPIERLPDDVLALIFEDFVAQWEAQRLAKALGRIQPLSSKVLSKWGDIPESWMSRWRLATLREEFESVLDVSSEGLAAFLRVITSVSRRWRRVALHCPRIWRVVRHGQHDPFLPQGLEIQDDQDLPLGMEQDVLDEPLEGALPLTNWRKKFFPFWMCLQRSGAVPLHARLEGSNAVSEFLDYLNSQESVHRLSHLEVSVFSGQEQNRDLDKITAMSMDHLESLAINVSMYASLDVDIPPDSLIDLLRSTPRLRALRVESIDFTTPEILGSTISMNALESLELALDSRVMMTYLFSVLHAPRLHRLLLGQTAPSDFEDLDPANPTEFERPPFGGIDPLKELALCGAFSKEELLQIIGSAPGIELLQMYDIGDPTTQNEVLQALVFQENATENRATRLDSLAFLRGHYGSLVPFDLLVRLIESRLSSRTASIVSVGFARQDLEDMDPRELQALAMKVDVFEWSKPWVDVSW